jgi:hypothetical protein
MVDRLWNDPIRSITLRSNPLRPHNNRFYLMRSQITNITSPLAWSKQSHGRNSPSVDSNDVCRFKMRIGLL